MDWLEKIKILVCGSCVFRINYNWLVGQIKMECFEDDEVTGKRFGCEFIE